MFYFQYKDRNVICGDRDLRYKEQTALNISTGNTISFLLFDGRNFKPMMIDDAC